VTLGLAVIIENALLYAFRADTRTVNVPYGFDVLDIGVAFLRSRAWSGSASHSWWRLPCGCSSTSPIPARRCVRWRRKKLGAELCGIDTSHIHAVTFGLGTACLAVAACLLIRAITSTRMSATRSSSLPSPSWFSAAWARWRGADRRPVHRSGRELCGLYLGESLGQIGIFLIFILVLLVRPTGLFGARA